VFNSLYSRAVLILLILLSFVGAAGITLTLVTTRQHLEEVDQRLNRDLAAQLVKETSILEDGRVQHQNLEHIFHMLMVINPRIEVYLLGFDGRILAFSAAEGKVKRESVALEPIESFLSDREHLPLRGDDPRDLERRKVFSVAPVPGDGSPQGYLYVVLNGEQYESVAQLVRNSYILRLSSLTAIGYILVALASALLLFRWLTRRLERLDRRVRSFREARLEDEGTGSTTSVPSSGDEIGRLESSFEQLRTRIERQVEELQRADALRRELVANVSHDLRTPLAALRGYLETLLLKGDSLPEKERREYLEIASRHSEALGELVAELFELAKLDSGETPLEIESFSMAELAQDIVEKFRLPATKSGVRLSTALTEELPFVEGDIGLIERALDNLIENAIRHTAEGGEVTVSVEPLAHSARIMVRDTGSGIPAEDRPFIFDRFYRGKNGGAGEGGGSGLGLAITKRILELHGSSIAVESSLGRGTSFSFVLTGVPA
jgi:signal transduction histidine kinase